MSKLILTPTEQDLDKQFREIHKDCSLENYCREEYTGLRRLWRKLTGKSTFRYKSGPYPEKFSYIISPTCIGESLSIRCNYCGETLDITDYDSW